ncbi:glycine/D-amino acid oxidase [Pseudomonas aeruginosa]|nr:glycine/D-amino acid oxidase [Pseudomonas aeruginosa]
MTFRPFWLDQALRSEHAAPCPPLAGDTRADVCIVGGGYTGLWTAIMLKEHDPGLDVVLVEADLCGAGASGRNGGCALSWSAKFFTLERLFGLTEAIRLVKASEDSIRAIGAFCQRYDVEADYRLDGTLYTATNPAQVGSTDSVIAALERHGINSFAKRPLADVQRLAGSRRHLEGWFSPAAATVQPGKLVRGLRRVALQLGVRLYEGTPMRGLEHGRPAEVVTPHGRVVAGRVVLALNAWMARAFPQFERSVAIVSSDMLITEPRPDLLQEIGLTSGVSVLDSRIFVHYYHNTPDGRLMLGKGGNTFAYGGRMLPVFDRPSPYLGQLRGSLREFFPELAEVAIEASWNGPSDRSVTGLPFFGRLDGRDNVFYGFGYSGSGRRSMPHGRADPFFAGARPGQSLDPFAADPGAARPLPAGADPLCRFADGAQRDPSQGARRRRRPAPASSRRTPGQVRRRRGQGRQGLSRFPGVSSAHSGAPFFFLRFRFRSSKGRKKRI